MGNVYVVPMLNQTIIADSEMVTIRAATTNGTRGSQLKILRLSCGQVSTTTSAQLAVRWGFKASAFGTFTSTTPSPRISGGVASAIAGGTSNAAATAGTDASANGAGTLTVLGARAFNNLAGFEMIFTPDEQPIVLADATFLLQLQGTPSALTGWYAELEYEEMI